MSHLLSFLESYTQMQLLQDKAGQYRARLRKEESRHRKQLRGLKRACRQRVQDKLSLIASLEGVICEQQGLLEKVRCEGEPRGPRGRAAVRSRPLGALLHGASPHGSQGRA